MKPEESGKELAKNIDENPSISSRKAACSLGIPRPLIITILHYDLNFKSYKYHDRHMSEELD